MIVHPLEIDSLFNLEEDDEKPIEKYSEDFTISDNDSEDDSENDEVKEMYTSKAPVPQSLPMNINFGVDPFTKQRRGPIEKEPTAIKVVVLNKISNV